MQIHSFTVGPFTENTYLLTQHNEALLIDPGFSKDNEAIACWKKLDEEEAELRAILLTHAHVDHVLGLQKALQYQDVPVYLNNNDRYLWNNIASQAQMFGFYAEAFSFEPEPLPVQENWLIASFTFDTLFTPGHAPDHVSLFNSENEFVIAGDALFKQGIGRTDLYQGSFEVLKKSIQEQLYTLPDNTTVYPGHGPTTTIGYEKKNNPFIKG